LIIDFTKTSFVDSLDMPSSFIDHEISSRIILTKGLRRRLNRYKVSYEADIGMLALS